MYLTVDTDNPLSTAITSSLKVSVPSGTTGKVGFLNEGYWGIPVNGDTYSNYFWIKGDYKGTVTLQLVGASSGTVYASKDLEVASTADNWTYYETSYGSTAAADGNNVWQLLFDASAVAGSALYFDLVQLFPPTFHDRFALTCRCLLLVCPLILTPSQTQWAQADYCERTSGRSRIFPSVPWGQ